jgi:hypothetical protein
MCEASLYVEIDKPKVIESDEIPEEGGIQKGMTLNVTKKIKKQPPSYLKGTST